LGVVFKVIIKIFFFLIFIGNFSCLNSNETEIVQESKAWTALNENYTINRPRLINWLEEFNSCYTQGKDTAYLVQRLMENESPEFICSLAYLSELRAEDDDKSILDEVRIRSSVTAVSLYQWAGEKGYSPAMARAAAIFDNHHDHQNAIKWEKKGVEAGNSTSMLQWGIRLIGGQELDGITDRNLEEGWKWIVIAGELGENQAEEFLRNGFGCPDYIINLGKIKAKEWIALHPKVFDKGKRNKESQVP
jgi:hypothetical protein